MKLILALMAVLALAGCNEAGPLADGRIVKVDAEASPVALLSLDGAPAEVSSRLASALSVQAATHGIRIVPEGGAPRYKLKGYVAASPSEKGTTITWVWDFFDGARQRTQRLSGIESIPGSNGWNGVDDAALQRIARGSMDGIALFLSGGSEAVAAARAPETGKALGFAGPE